MARVLVLSLVFPPDAVSTAQIMGDLADDLARRGHDVTVLTTTPHYNRDADAEARQPRRPWWGRLVQRSEFRGLPVLHTWMPAKSASVPMRLLAWSLFHALSVVVGVAAIRRVDVILVPSPPLTMGVAAWLLGRWHRAPFVYNVQELYPDIAINLGAVRHPVAIRLLFGLERFVYARASAITVIAERMRRRLLDKGVAPDKVSVIPNFVDTSDLRAVPAPNGFSAELGLDGRFVVCYAGNLGPAQGLDTLLDAAARLQDDPRIAVVLVGGGTHWHHLARRIRDERLANVHLVPHQPYARVPEIYGASDLSVVPQAAAIGADAVPSKVYRIMACGRVVLAATEPDSDLAVLVRTAGCGIVVPQDAPAAIAEAIRTAAAGGAALAAMGEAGRRHVAEHYARPVVTGRYHALVDALARRRAA
ncbi:MAG: glycosyltransferase family 4 protein [Vicinamibacterales bacterium]